MKRRSFIKKSLLSLPVFLFTPSFLLTSCDEEDEDIQPNGKKVIIIGAGISGLAAAKKLKSKGFEVLVLESQDKVGGRLRTNRTLGFAFDEGGSWIHGMNGNPLTTLAQEAGMSTVLTDDDSFLCYDKGGTLINETTFSKEETLFYEMMDSLQNNGSTDVSFESVFNNNYSQYSNNRLWKFFLSTYLTFNTGDLNNLSSNLYNEGEEFSGNEEISTNGYDTIPKYLANNINISLNQIVTKVDYANSKVKVTHNDNTSEADFVICTVPLGVLKKGKIIFSPQLNTMKQEAIQKIGMNCVNKFLLTWDEAFWDDVQYIAYTPDEKDKFNYFLNVKKIHPNHNALMTFAYAEYARSTETMSDSEITEAIMNHLKDIYGPEIPYPTNLLRTKWNSNENTYGSYSYTAVGTEMKHFETIAEQIDNKLFFAGEHTEPDYFSAAHGAYLSGIREADKIINLI